MTTKKLADFAPLLVVLTVLILGGIGLAVMRLESLTGQADSFRLDVSRQYHVDPVLLDWKQDRSYAVPLAKVSALATGPDGEIYVAGDSNVLVLDRSGGVRRKFNTGRPPVCMAVGGEDHVAHGRVYVGSDASLGVYSESGEPISNWDVFEPGAKLTAISLGPEHVYVADAGNRIVMCFDAEGELVGRIGDVTEDSNAYGFIVPSGYFDLVAAGNGLIHIVNPGARRIETYTESGRREAFWGRAGADFAGFFGCCNPAHLAQLPDGRFVTSEKGIPRVKVYDGRGELQSVVAGPNELSVPTGAIGDPRPGHVQYIYDIAVDSSGRILVLDPIGRQVLVFVSGRKADDNE